MTLPQIVAIFGLVILLTILFIIMNFFSHWLRCYSSGCPVSMWELIFLKIRRIPLVPNVDAYISARKKNFPINFQEVANKYQEDPKGFSTYVKALLQVADEEGNIQPVAGGNAVR